MPDKRSISRRRLWFGTTASAASWIVLGISDVLITWKACKHQENFGLPESDHSVAFIFLLLSAILFVVTVAAGVTSLRNLRIVSSETSLTNTPAVERREFMAYIGIIVSVTLGAGILWLSIPPLLLELCWRAR